MPLTLTGKIMLNLRMRSALSPTSNENIFGTIFEITNQEKLFFVLISVSIIIAGGVFPYPHVAMWVGFMLAGYSAIANDSIQTIGTFITSNIHRKWWHLWLYMGAIFVITITYSWWAHNGDVSYQRLASKGFSEAPTQFTFFQLASPLVLLILTRMRMPVSTTFLLLNTFSSEAKAIFNVIDKSILGYFLSFLVAFISWTLISRFAAKHFKGEPAKWWMPVQWITSGALWSVWLMQDAANIAIFLPRSLSLWQFVFFITYIFFGLGLLFYLKGDKIQGIVNEKTGIQDVRAATIVDLVYAVILCYFKVLNTIPISTTWVFIGLLGGRELAINLAKNKQHKNKKYLKSTFLLIGKDVLFATIGLVISLFLAFAINDDIRNEVLGKWFN